jgi:hypothetical protein
MLSPAPAENVWVDEVEPLREVMPPVGVDEERKSDGFLLCHVPSQFPVVVATYTVEEARNCPASFKYPFTTEEVTYPILFVHPHVNSFEDDARVIGLVALKTKVGPATVLMVVVAPLPPDVEVTYPVSFVNCEIFDETKSHTKSALVRVTLILEDEVKVYVV